MQIGFVPVAFSPLLCVRAEVCVRAREIAGLAPARVLVAAVGWEDRTMSVEGVGWGGAVSPVAAMSQSRD